MSFMTPKKDWFPDTISLAKHLRESDYNRAEYADAKQYQHVRVDMTKDFTGTGSDRTISANATVFMLAKFTTPFPNDIGDSWLRGKLTFRNKDYKIVNWSYYRDDQGQLYSVELKVI